MLKKLEIAGCEKSVVGLVITTGYSFNLDGTSIFNDVGKSYSDEVKQNVPNSTIKTIKDVFNNLASKFQEITYDSNIKTPLSFDGQKGHIDSDIDKNICS